ncbi:MAG: hypothetical protein HRU00_17155 [Myxococcales bacterium]|nr:hypothetical protein [Myxococcales bacterium]
MKWVELCCGSAAVTLRLIGGARAVPPVSYQGAKRKYARAILESLGLRAGEGADAVMLCEVGPWGEAWSHIVGGFDLGFEMNPWNAGNDAEQVETWIQLRKQLPKMDPGPARAAAWLWLLQRSFGCKGPHAGMASRRITLGPKSKQGEWRHTLDAPKPRLRKLEAVPWPENTLVHHGDARDIEPFGDAVV